jgi:hypothetical protein
MGRVAKALRYQTIETGHGKFHRDHRSKKNRLPVPKVALERRRDLKRKKERFIIEKMDEEIQNLKI